MDKEDITPFINTLLPPLSIINFMQCEDFDERDLDRQRNRQQKEGEREKGAVRERKREGGGRQRIERGK